AAAPRLGVTVISVSVGPRIEFETAFAAMMKERPDAFAMTAEPVHQIRIAWIMDFMAKNRLPAVYQLSENVRAGGLMSYGASQPASVKPRRWQPTKNVARPQPRRPTGGAAGQIRAGR